MVEMGEGGGGFTTLEIGEEEEYNEEEDNKVCVPIRFTGGQVKNIGKCHGRPVAYRGLLAV